MIRHEYSVFSFIANITDCSIENMLLFKYEVSTIYFILYTVYCTIYFMLKQNTRE
jgi:hypothetical protein